MSDEDSTEDIPGLVPWVPEQSLKNIDARELQFSRGFLRCRPEKWFSGMAAQWLPLQHSLGADIRVLEVRPTVALAPELPFNFSGSLKEHQFSVGFDNEAADAIALLLAPGGGKAARAAVIEYMARRLVGSLAFAWSGGDSKQIFFRPDLDPNGCEYSGSVRITLELQGRSCKAWVALSEGIISQLDGLWRRQLHSSIRNGVKAGVLTIELAQLAVPPSVLGEYLRAGAIVDLEVPVSNSCTLQLNGRPWLPARLLRLEDTLAFEVIAGPVSNPTLPPGTTRLSIDMASLNLDSESIAELGQVGAVWNTGVELSESVDLSINAEKVGSARLYTFQGRFAISVS